uniref:RRM domain-containing protein n=1 Tax=Anguilla anguilla TaxID=7936 RepID=A0A0E9W711_ANGAN
MGIVRFGTLHDAYEGLKRDREYIGTRFVEINSCSEKQWVEAGGSVGPHTGNAAEFHRESPPSYVEKRYPQQRTKVSLTS